MTRLLATRTKELAEVRRVNNDVSIKNVEGFGGDISEWYVPVNIPVSHTDVFQLFHIAHAVRNPNFKRLSVTFSTFVIVSYVIICHRRNEAFSVRYLVQERSHIGVGIPCDEGINTLWDMKLSG